MVADESEAFVDEMRGSRPAEFDVVLAFRAEDRDTTWLRRGYA